MNDASSSLITSLGASTLLKSVGTSSLEFLLLIGTNHPRRMMCRDLSVCYRSG